MLKNPRIEIIPKNRKIYHGIKWIGKNVLVNRKEKYRNLNVSFSKHNVVFILIAINEICYMENLMFLTEKGDMISHSKLNNNRRGYVFIAAIRVTKSSQNKQALLTEERFNIVSKFYINQIKQSQGTYHFGTSGTIYGLGYGPKYH